MRIMKYLFTLMILLMAVFYISGCKDKIVTEADVKPVILPQNVHLSKFSELQKNIFTTSCAISGCHTQPNPQRNLDLSEGKAYSNLINVQSEHFPNLKRVLPGNYEQSVLYIAVSYTSNQLQMPPTGKLGQYLIDSLGAWIDKGALNN